MSAEPLSLRAGDSVAWTKSLPSYPASAGWVLAYRLIPQSGLPFAINTAAAGDDHAVSLDSTATQSLPAGPCLLVGTVSRAGERQTIYNAPVTVLPDLATASAFDPRSLARRALEQLRAVFAAASADSNALTQEYQIAGRMRRFRTVEEIIMAIRFWEGEVAREESAAALMAGGFGAGRVQVRI